MRRLQLQRTRYFFGADVRSRWSFAELKRSTGVRYRLDFLPPCDPGFFVYFGHEAPIGFWAELWERGQRRPIAAYSAIDAEYRSDRPLLGVLEWLAQVGAFSASALEEALSARGSAERVRLSRGAKRALQVIAALITEAG